MTDFEVKLSDALGHYHQTIELIDRLLEERKAPQEIILLACGWLDSLANLIYPSIASQQKSFRRFVEKYSGQNRFFNSVSIGDLYRYLTHYGELADGGIVSAPGRVSRLGSDSEHFLVFIERSGVPVTGKDVSRISSRIANCLSKYFRVKPRQHLSKPYRASSKRVREIIAQEIKKPSPDDLVKAIDPILERFKCSNILYRDYRNQSIHGFKILLNEDDFFSESKPFHGEFEYLDETVILKLEFPGKYLRDLLEKCLTTVTSQLLANRKVPADLFSEMYLEEFWDTDAFEYFDDESYEDFIDVKWRLNNR